MTDLDQPHVSPSNLTCGCAIAATLEACGTRVVFGIPGVHNLELYRGLAASSLRHVTARHEQGAGFMADGYARASGIPGVAFTISGPGVTNIATAVAQAHTDSVPILVIASAVALPELGNGRGLLHEIIDQVAVIRPIAGLAHMATTPSQAIRFIHAAFRQFAATRPRPAFLSVPHDVLAAGAASLDRAQTGGCARPGPDADAIEAAAAILHGAQCPIIVAGGGAVDASEALRRIAEALAAPLVTTIAAKGVLPWHHPLCLGSTLQRPAVQAVLERADALLLVGTELAEPDLYITAGTEAPGSQTLAQKLQLAPGGRVIRVDIDPSQLAKDDHAEIRICGDASIALKALAAALPAPLQAPQLAPDMAALRHATHRAATPLEAVHLTVLEPLREALADDAIIAADMTQLAYTACVLLPMARPRCFLFPNGFGTLGYALPAAIGAKLACPHRQVVAIAGDCGFLFTCQELATAVQEELAIAIVLWNNDALGEIRDGMVARGIPPIGVEPRNPDFAALARSFGCEAETPQSPAAFAAALRDAHVKTSPTVIIVNESVARAWSR